MGRPAEYAAYLTPLAVKAQRVYGPALAEYGTRTTAGYVYNMTEESRRTFANTDPDPRGWLKDWAAMPRKAPAGESLTVEDIRGIKTVDDAAGFMRRLSGVAEASRSTFRQAGTITIQDAADTGYHYSGAAEATAAGIRNGAVGELAKQAGAGAAVVAAGVGGYALYAVIALVVVTVAISVIRSKAGG